MQNFNNLRVYDAAKKFAVEIYNLTRYYPKEEMFGIVSQMRRAAVSIGANIAEGTGRSTDADFKRFLFNSIGSLKEIEYMLDLSKELNYIDAKEHQSKSEKAKEISGMLIGLIRAITMPHKSASR